LKKSLLLLGGAAVWLIGPALFLAVEHAGGWSGFALDDAWIHQTYARSLAQGAGWSYAGGAPSAGSTSPLWTLLLVPAFWLRISPLVWTSALGILLLLADAVLIGLWVRKLDPGAARYAFLFCVLEWHLVWAALSGMETILFCAWIALTLWLFFPLNDRGGIHSMPPGRIAALGVAAGIGIWIRPEAVVLSAFILAAVALPSLPIRTVRLLGFLAAFCVPLAAYFYMEYRLGGRFLPNTFFVKTAEYSALTSAGLLLRFVQTWIPLLTGALVLLILFLPAALLGFVQERRFAACLPFLWAICHLGLYAVQLPAGYQHGRYFLPVLPVLIAYGVLGYRRIRHWAEARFLARVLSRAVWASAFLVAAVFLWLGARQFAADVSFIETGMVRTALWIRANTPADTVVAAHDIGALGFFGERKLIDLGGVTDLGALPLLSGETSLRDYLRARGADLLMTIPDFYAAALERCVPIPEYPPSAAAEHPTLLYDPRGGCP
jgi:arabinofuranosyltransferase